MGYFKSYALFRACISVEKQKWIFKGQTVWAAWRTDKVMNIVYSEFLSLKWFWYFFQKKYNNNSLRILYFLRIYE